RAMQRVEESARKNDIKIALTLSDPSIVDGYKERFNQLTRPKLDLLFSNREEAHNYTGKDDFNEVLEELKKYASAFVVTCGAEGSVIFDGNKLYEIEPIKAAAVDTNGAGDMYAGTFLYGITNGLSFEEAGKLASRTSTEVVSQYGPRLDEGEI